MDNFALEEAIQAKIKYLPTDVEVTVYARGEILPLYIKAPDRETAIDALITLGISFKTV